MSTTLLRVDASIRRTGSVSRGVADTFESEINADTVIRRDVGSEPIASDTWPLAVGLQGETGGADQQAASALAATLADELVAADTVILAVPLYNFGVPAQVKTWIDVILTDARFAPGAGPSPIADRPAFLVVTRGGGYGPGTPRDGWDHATGYLRRILADVWGLDLHVIEAELTLADTTPGMETLREQAAANLETAHTAARTAGQQLLSVTA